MGHAAAHRTNADAPGQAAASLRNVSGGLFISNIYQSYSRLKAGCQKRVKTMAAQRGDELDTAFAEFLHE
jgi:hypothetical protein